MNAAITEELTLILQTARQFARDELGSDPDAHGAGAFPWDVLSSAHEQGFTMCSAPEALGGIELDRFGQALFLSRLAAGSASVAAILATHLTALGALCRDPSTSAYLETLLETDADRPRLLGLAFPEWICDSAGDRALICPIDAARCDAVLAIFDGSAPNPHKTGGGETITKAKGDKEIGSQGQVARGAAVFFNGCGETSPISESSRALVGRGFGGTRADPIVAVFSGETIAQHARPSYCGSGLDDLPSIRIDGAAVRELESQVELTHAAMPGAILSTYELMLAAVQVGNARASLEFAVDYAQERKQTGRPIIDHQNVRATLVNMELLVNAAESFVMRAATDPNAFLGPHDLCRQAYGFANQVCETVCLDAIQCLGGYGYMKDYGLERRLRDCKTLQALTGGHICSKLGLTPI